MKNFFDKIKQFIGTHKTVTIIVLIVITYAGYWGYGKITSTAGETRYVTSKAEKGTIIEAITGTGQVSASNQIDLKPKASGEITYLPMQSGQRISNGALIAQIDTADAQKTIRDAQASLDNAKLSLEKLKIQDSASNMNADLSKAHDDGFNSVSNTFLDLPSIMTGLNNMFFKSDATGRTYIYKYAESTGSADREKANTYRDSVISSYNLANDAYNTTFEQYKNTSRNSSSADIEALITQTYNTTKLVSDTIKNSNNYIDFVNKSMVNNNFDIPSYIATHKAILNSYTSQTNSHLNDLLSVTTSIKSAKDAFLNNDLDVQSSELSVKQKENALQDAKDNLSNYSVYAPFGGTISNVAVKKTDSVSSGTVIATLITDKQVAEISFNEVDVAKIQIGQKATLTFDAIPDLTIAGQVISIDSIGTVSSGVVNYTVKISFDTNDVRVKPGMSVNSNIIINIKQDILTVPNSAVKSQNGASYVETFDTALPAPAIGAQGSPSLTPPNKINVVTGISSDTVTEIVSGLNEGALIVTKTITGSATTATKTTSTKSILSAVGGSGGPRN